MPARVGRSGSEGKPAVETKPREAELSLSLPTWVEAMASPTPNSACSPGMLVLLALRTGFQ